MRGKISISVKMVNYVERSIPLLEHVPRLDKSMEQRSKHSCCWCTRMMLTSIILTTVPLQVRAPHFPGPPLVGDIAADTHWCW